MASILSLHSRRKFTTGPMPSHRFHALLNIRSRQLPSTTSWGRRYKGLAIAAPKNIPQFRFSVKFRHIVLFQSPTWHPHSLLSLRPYYFSRLAMHVLCRIFSSVLRRLFQLLSLVPGRPGGVTPMGTQGRSPTRPIRTRRA